MNQFFLQVYKNLGTGTTCVQYNSSSTSTCVVPCVCVYPCVYKTPLSRVPSIYRFTLYPRTATSNTKVASTCIFADKCNGC